MDQLINQNSVEAIPSNLKYELARKHVESCQWPDDENLDAGLVVYQVKSGFYNCFIHGYEAAYEQIYGEYALTAEIMDDNSKYQLYDMLRKAGKLLRQKGYEMFAVDIEKMLTETKGKLGIDEIKK